VLEQRIVYLFPAFPVFHQTFVLWEVLGLRRNGICPRIYSLRRARGQQQPEAADVSREVTYLPRLFSPLVWRANWRLFRQDRRRYLRLYAALVSAWRTGAADVPALDPAQRPRVALYNRLRGWFNSQPHLYLLKSFLLVPTAVYLAEQLRVEGITHVHAQWASYPGTVAYLVHLISGLPFSISAHAYDIYMVPRMLPAKLKAARFLVTCAQTNAAFLQRLGGSEARSKIVVNYHGVDVHRFTPRATNTNGSKPLQIISCGQLERYKGMHLLIGACATLSRQGIGFDCSIIGEGPQRAQLERQISRLGLGAKVHLLGSRPHAEVAELYRQADVFVLASELAGKSGRRDVIANVIVEAMAAGLPTVVSRIPGIEELVEDGVTGYLVPPNHPEAFAVAMKKLADHPDDRVRIGAAARSRVLRDFDQGKNVRLLARVFVATAGDVEGSLADRERQLSALVVNGEALGWGEAGQLNG
jgi:colanic acid/amylovoran biosynthesis glycosyltransferase